MDFQEKLAELVVKDRNELTEADIAFLRARRDYLTEEQVINLLGHEDVPAPEATVSEEQPAAEPSAKPAAEPVETKKRKKSA